MYKHEIPEWARHPKAQETGDRYYLWRPFIEGRLAETDEERMWEDCVRRRNAELTAQAWAAYCPLIGTRHSRTSYTWQCLEEELRDITQLGTGQVEATDGVMSVVGLMLHYTARARVQEKLNAGRPLTSIEELQGAWDVAVISRVESYAAGCVEHKSVDEPHEAWLERSRVSRLQRVREFVAKRGAL